MNNCKIDLCSQKTKETLGHSIAYDQRHQLTVKVGTGDEPGVDYANLFFSSREALYEFGLFCLLEALYTPENDRNICCEREFLSYNFNDNFGIRVVDGIRLSADSARLNIYADDKLK